MHPFSTVLGILLVLLSLFDVWLWRLPLLRGWFVSRPNLIGTWRLRLKAANGPGSHDVEGYAVVRQTYSFLSLRVLTAESSSELLTGSVLGGVDGTFRVTGVYRNEPRLTLRSASQIHYGAVLLSVSEPYPERVQGQYWTDRATRGEMELSKRARSIASDYSRAGEIFGDPAPEGKKLGEGV